MDIATDKQIVRFCLHAVVVMQHKEKLLLIDSCGCKQSSLYARTEPIRVFVHFLICTFTHFFIGRPHIFDYIIKTFLLRVLHTLRRAITEGYNTVENFAFADLILVRLLAERQPHPTGVQAQSLSQQHNLLATISDDFIRTFLADHRQIIAHAAELAILGESAGESIRFVGH